MSTEDASRRNYRLAVLLVFLVASCAIFEKTSETQRYTGYHSGQPFEQEHDVRDVLARLHWFDTLEDLQKEFGEDVLGFSECSVAEDQDFAICDLYLVRPQTIDDEWTNTVGHELLHGAYGQYHPDD